MRDSVAGEPTAEPTISGRWLLVPVAGTTVDDDVEEPVDAVDAIELELAVRPPSPRASILRCASSQAAESRFVSDPSSSLLLRGEGGTGGRDDPLMFEYNMSRLWADGVWNPRVGFGGLRGVCGMKGRPGSEYSRDNGASDLARLRAPPRACWSDTSWGEMYDCGSGEWNPLSELDDADTERGSSTWLTAAAAEPSGWR